MATHHNIDTAGSGRLPRTTVVSFRDVRKGPWNAHGFALSDLIATMFDASTIRVQDPTREMHRVIVSKGKRLDLVRRLPYRSSVQPTIASLPPTDFLFVVAHDATDLDQLFVTEPDWLDTRATKVLVLIEVWAEDARRWPTTYARTLPKFDAVFCTLEEGIGALEAASGVHVEVMAQAVDVLNAPFSLDPRLDVLSIGRRHAAQHDLLQSWAARDDGWYHFDTLPVGNVADVDLHRRATATMLARSAVSICNFARFDDTSRIGSTKGTGTRFFETLASGALIAGELPTDPMFADQFAGAPGVAEFPLDCGDLDESTVADLVAMGRDPVRRRGNRLHALGHQDLAHRARQILGYVGIEEPTGLTDRFAALDVQRSELARA